MLDVLRPFYPVNSSCHLPTTDYFILYSFLGITLVALSDCTLRRRMEVS